MRIEKTKRHFRTFCEFNKHNWENNPQSLAVYTGYKNIDMGIQKALGYYVSACLGCRDGDFPNVETYIACLSDNFLNGILTEARIHGELPEYNQKLAKKYNISPGNSYC